MTREELKNIVRHVFHFYDANAEDPNWADMNEACGEIIKALEQKPYEKFESVKDHICKLAGDYKCWDNRLTPDEALELCHILEQEPCEDAVSREAVKNVLPRQRFIGYEAYLQCFIEIDNLPSVMPTRKKGRWIYTPQKRLVDETDEGPVYEVQEKCNCSACGADFGYCKVDDNYCKYCGCQMCGE